MSMSADCKNIFEIPIAQIIRKYGLLTNRRKAQSLGQHFLCDVSLLKKIVSRALPIDATEHVVEVGPGPCGLTREIIKACGDGRRVTCIEKDVSFKPIHDELLAGCSSKLKFIYSDATKIRLEDLEPRLPIVIISNLPYNVGTRLLINWLNDASRIRRMALMFQKEVADRICARHGVKQYGRLSVISQIVCHTEKMFDISRAAFYPPPKVESTVVKLTPKNCVDADELRLLDVLTARCFSNRRKTLHKILREYYKAGSDDALKLCGIDASARPEDVDPRTFLELSNKLKTLDLSPLQ
ncbi:MAG: 16S rRNA (adenine(1518)-N(6)/adenine(1519)-N(6))-dimethyltransferase RsmA [Holosporales bacterium]|jgi:16S rRNA (adenine1518-N6/adenine1519-N6)-dimethyltransferase|nr:16S rRNA (adenine(1518)-N(6)/adenine(1519)-N(6))-dimethyltransferase RsmA [Holosporales bacterium]